MRPGTGVGLFVVWQIARLHGGSVDARSREGSWAEFTLDLPKAAATP
jgi:signal transduction histidine kinase